MGGAGSGRRVLCARGLSLSPGLASTALPPGLPQSQGISRPQVGFGVTGKEKPLHPRPVGAVAPGHWDHTPETRGGSRANPSIHAQAAGGLGDPR